MRRISCLSIMFVMILTVVINPANPSENSYASLTAPDLHSNAIEENSFLPQTISWNKTYGGTGTDRFYSVKETSDGGFIAAGTLNQHFWLVKTDYEGNVQWNKTYGSGFNNVAYSVEKTSDGGYILAGYSAFSNPPWIGGQHTDTVVIKTDAFGNQLWTRTPVDFHGGPDYQDRANSVIETSDGSYLVGGVYEYLDYFNHQFPTLFVMKIGSGGSRIFEMTFPDHYVNSQAYSVAESSDCYIAAGNGYLQGLIVGIEKSNGQLIWQQLVSGSVQDISSTTDGGFIAIVNRLSYNSSLLKLSPSYEQIWQRPYGTNNLEKGYSVVQTIDGGYFIAGYSGNYDAILTKTDGNGDVEWDQTIGGSNYDELRDVSLTSDGGVILSGSTQSYGSGGSDAWLVKTTRGFSISAYPSAETLVAGSSRVFYIELVTYDALNSPVVLAASDLPRGVTAAFNPSILNPDPDADHISELTLSSSTSAMSGSYAITVEGISGTLVRTCQITLTLRQIANHFKIAQEKKLSGEKVYIWQTISYKGKLYSILLYSKSHFNEFSIQNQYIDKPLAGPLRIRVPTAQGYEWANIEGVIIVDEQGEAVKNDEASRAILTLAEAQAYDSYVKQNKMQRDDFSAFYYDIEETVNALYSDPVFWPTLALYHEIPLGYSQRLYKELLISAFEKSPIDKSEGTGNAEDEINKYISTADGIISSAAEYLELSNYKQFLEQSSDLQILIEKSDYLSKLNRNLKDLFDRMESYSPHGVFGKYFVRFMIGMALEKTIAEDYLTYLEALKDYVEKNPKIAYSPEWSALFYALQEVIDISQGPDNMFYQIMYQIGDVALEWVWDTMTDKIVEGFKEAVEILAPRLGLSISQVGSIMTSASVGVSLGIILGDLIFDLSGFYYNCDLMVKAKYLNNIITETYDKISSSDLTVLQANIETRRLQFSLMLETYELLADNADGSGISGVLRGVWNYLADSLRRLTNSDIQTTEDYINTIRSIWIPYYSFLRDLAVPPLHDVETYDPKWKPFFYSTSSTAVVSNMMFARRGLNDPGIITFIEVDRYWFEVGNTGVANVTVLNPSDTDIHDIWINATLDAGTNLNPQNFHIETLQAYGNLSVTFEFSFNRPGLHAMSFLVDGENRSYVSYESVLVRVYLHGLTVTMSPELPLMNDNVHVTVQNATGFRLENASVTIQNPMWMITAQTDATGVMTFVANVTGLWSLSATFNNEPAYGPVQFIVSSNTSDSFLLETNNINSTDVSANETYCEGFRIVNLGANNLQLQISLSEGADWLGSWIATSSSSEANYENITITNSTSAEVNLPRGHWTSGYLFIATNTEATLGYQTTLNLTVSAAEGSVSKTEGLEVTVDTEQLQVSISQPGRLYHGETLSTLITVEDRYGSQVLPDRIAATLDDINVTEYISKIANGLYNLTIPNISSGTRTLSVDVWKQTYSHKSISVQVEVSKRPLIISLTNTREGQMFNLQVHLTDGISPSSMTGASIWGVLEDQHGNKTTIPFTEFQSEVYDSEINLTQFALSDLLKLTICASKAGYSQAICSTTINRADINADDSVSVVDMFTLAVAFGSTPTSPKWNPNADLNNDLAVDSADLEILSRNYGKTDL